MKIKKHVERTKMIEPPSRSQKILRQLKFQFLYKLTPAEWVCFIFIIVSIMRVATTGESSHWSNVKWSVFPKSDILLIALTAVSLKLFRKDPRTKNTLITLSVVSYFGFQNSDIDSMIPIKAWLHPTVIGIIEAIRWPTLIFYLGVFTRAITKNNQVKILLRQIRLTLPILVMPLLYPFTPLIIQASKISDKDELLRKIDTGLFFGHDPILLFEKCIHPYLSEWMAFSYSFYGIFFLLTFAFLYLKENEIPSQELILNSTLTFAIGYWGYTFIPAKGPLFMQSFEKSLDLFYMKDIQYALADHARIERDCFPSLHTAITLVTGYSAYKHLRKFFWICSPVIASIPVACIYLRYHYVVDIIAGLALALIVIRTAPLLGLRFQKTLETQNNS